MQLTPSQARAHLLEQAQNATDFVPVHKSLLQLACIEEPQCEDASVNQSEATGLVADPADEYSLASVMDDPVADECEALEADTAAPAAQVATSPTPNPEPAPAPTVPTVDQAATPVAEPQAPVEASQQAVADPAPAAPASPPATAPVAAAPAAPAAPEPTAAPARRKVTCPHCGASLQANDALLGKTVKCPGCGQLFTLPAA